MKDVVCEVIQSVFLLALVVIFIILGVRCAVGMDKKKWNNGYCECGGHWIYEQAVGHQYRTSYIYKCDKCGKRIESWALRRQDNEQEN